MAYIAYFRGGVIFMAERRKSPKKVAENWKKECAGNRKIVFLSHGKPEKMKLSAKNGKLFLKTAETGKLFCQKLRKTRKQPKDNEKWQKAGKQGKKLRKPGKT